MSKRVLIAGLFHETHTFLDELTSLDDCQLRRGSELLAARGDGSPLAGALEVAAECGWQVCPTIDVRAIPSGTVEDVVVETFWDGFCASLADAPVDRFDGLYLVLHGAMVSESLPDVEGEIISRIRALPGFADVPICGVLDLHGNISASSIEQTDGLVAYRCNPHIDACHAAMDGARLLDRILQTGQRPTSVWRQPPIVWPPTGTGTDNEPMRSLEAMARQIEQNDPEIAAVNVFGGFSFADTHHTGVSFSAITFGDRDHAGRRLDELCDWAVTHRDQANVVDRPLEQCVPEILERISRGEGPIVIVEPADNIGGGAPGDGTSILRAFVRHDFKNAAVVINDPQSVERLKMAMPGQRVRLAIGGRGSRLAEGPLELNVELLATSDGQFDLEDRNSHYASYGGTHVDMGCSATVRHEGIRILITSRKTPPFDLGQLRSQGIEPETLSVIGVKAAVAHRRAYEDIQKGSYTVSTPGPCSSDVTLFPYTRLRRPVYPLDVE